MIPLWLYISIPLAAGVLAWLAARANPARARWVAMLAMLAVTLLAGLAWAHNAGNLTLIGRHAWGELELPWIPQLGITFHLYMDGLGGLMVLLTGIIGILAVAASWGTPMTRPGAFYFCLLWALGSVVSVFLAVDLFLFYLSWELMLVPTYFLIGVWGGQRRVAATLKFFLFTQAGGVLLLVSILGLVFVHYRATGDFTFDFFALLGAAHTLNPVTASWLMLGFFLAFAVKLPVIGVHSWLPDAHEQAPPDGSVDLAGLVIKVAPFAMIRFLVPLFGATALAWREVGMALAVVGVIYGALTASSQINIKRLVAYSGISHMGFALLGICAWNELALSGVIVIILASGLSAAGMFVLAGMVYRRAGTADMTHTSGLWALFPRTGGAAMFLTMATMGLPALGTFIGEVLVLFGAYQVSPGFTLLAACGLFLSVVYALLFMQRVFQGPLMQPPDGLDRRDLSLGESASMALCIALIVVIGVYPNVVLRTISQPVSQMLEQSGVRAPGMFNTLDASKTPGANAHGKLSVGISEEAPHE